MKILLLGKNGQVGYELLTTLAPLGEVTALGRTELDLTNTAAIRSTVRRINPAIIVNAAAYTAVDKAEAEPELAMAINANAPGILAQEAAACNALLVHYSTDYIFDGTKNEPYTEQDTPNPLSAYGKTKLAGEEAICSAGCRHLILRTSWVYGLRGQNFLLTIMRLAAERSELKVVADQHGAPTWCRLIAQVTATMLANLSLTTTSPGLYHLTAAGATTWHGFAEAIINQAAAKGLLKNKPALKALTTDQYPTPATRPANSRLSCARLEKYYNLTLPPWQNQLKTVLDEITANHIL
jgi:dTDP-4-dehydrorhamnose reductase